MSNIQQRKYYKLFTGTNQEDGYSNIHLGYEAQTSEIILKKDSTTFFHIPFFASAQLLSNSSLGADGAFSGPIPALADRISKKLGNYGNSTPWGTPTGQKDGVWLCSWYYSVSSEPPIWLDRYYNPGRLAYEEALKGEASFTDYIKHDPLYYDVPTSLTLEPGVLYQYYHNGEKAISEIIETFSGNNKDRLRLNIDNWQTLEDKSSYKNTIAIDNLKDEWIIVSTDPGYEDRNALSFNNSDFINSRVLYNKNYNFENEFTLSFWVNNDNWSNATSTQLIGNLQKGGYGIFYNNLNYNPYFAIPETTYGHLFFVNQEGNVYFDKNTQYKLGNPTNPEFVGMNSNNEIITIDSKNFQLLKYNQVGDVITTSLYNNGSPFVFLGTPQQLLIDGNDNSFVLTTSALYCFDKDLVLLEVLSEKSNGNEVLAFTNNGVLVKELSCTDVKFDLDGNKWVLKNDQIYKNNIHVLTTLNYICENINIDPDGDIWILARPNIVLKLNPLTLELIDIYNVGIDTVDINYKNLSFIQNYNRLTNSYTWYAYIYHNYDKTLYQVTLDGRTVKTNFLPQKLNVLDPATKLQNRNLLTFKGKGDFTGYDRRRIFNSVIYNNNKQLQFKVSVKPSNRNLPPSLYTLSVPVNYLQNSVWHLITVVFKNQQANLYIDNYLRDSITLPGNIDLSYEFKNDLIIGCPCGKNDNLNKDINTSSIIWNGYIDAIRIYDYAIDPRFIKYLTLEKTNASDIEWNIPTTSIQYVEEIDRFFKHRLPGSKSTFFNIKVSGSKITDPEVREQIERDIRAAISQNKPGYTELLRVEWID
jgi:hypothetical protein